MYKMLVKASRGRSDKIWPTSSWSNRKSATGAFRSNPMWWNDLSRSFWKDARSWRGWRRWRWSRCWPWPRWWVDGRAEIFAKSFVPMVSTDFLIHEREERERMERGREEFKERLVGERVNESDWLNFSVLMTLKKLWCLFWRFKFLDIFLFFWSKRLSFFLAIQDSTKWTKFVYHQTEKSTNWMTHFSSINNSKNYTYWSLSGDI